MRFIFPLIMAFLLCGCATNNVQVYSTVDPSAKTITVPPGSSGLKGDIKKALSARGWKMRVYSGPEVIEGKAGTNTSLQRYDTFNTRYSLFAYSRQFDVCFNFSPAVRYELTLVDNKDGSEVLTMDGRDCQDKIAQQFVDALENKK